MIRWRVVCGFRDVMLIFSPTSALSSVDLPTDGRPTIATWPQRCGRCRRTQPCGAARGACGHARRSARSAASCSATRRLVPVPDVTIDSAGILHSTVNCCACASPAVATIAYSGTGQALRLQPFLQPRLRILAEPVRGSASLQQLAEHAADHAARRVESGVDRHGAEDRLERIGEDRPAIGAAALVLPLAQPDRRAEPELRARAAPGYRG